MKATDQAIAEIAHLSLNPIMGRLLERAREEVAENFCKPKCGHDPEGSFCTDAQITYRELLKHLFDDYAGLN